MKAVPGPEMSRHLEKAIFSNSLTQWLHILPETGALILHLESGLTPSTWGLIYRNTKPLGLHSKEIGSIIPLFSLWSTDRFKSFDPTIVEQLFDLHGNKLTDMFLERVLFSLIDAYFGLVTRYGLQIELNAQNILLGFNEALVPVAIIFRDLNGIEKDMPIHNHLGLNTQYESTYKEIRKESGSDNYVIRHSFAFDSKLTHYVLLPVASAVAQAVGKSCDFFLEELRTHVRGWLTQLPRDYFPEGNIWYTHEDIDLSKERPYLVKNNPPLR
jgi:hypothetical protein